MILKNSLVRQYQKQHKLKYGEDISPKDAERELLALSNLVRLITKARRQRHGN